MPAPFASAAYRANASSTSPEDSRISSQIRGELRKLGIDVAKSTVEKYMVRQRRPPSPTWRAFLKNELEGLAAIDFFVVPTATFRVIFVFVVLSCERRRIVHFNVTEQVVHALTLRHQADAAGGALDGESDEASDDDGPRDGPSYWKISPGEVGGEWPTCRDKQVILIGWKELGDLSGIDEAEFDRRAAAARKDHDWGGGVAQAWKFRNIRVGDRIVANAGTKRVLGIGTVTGPYQFVSGSEYPHRLPVRWDDVEPRIVDMPGWRRTLVRLTESTFNTLAQAPQASAVVADAPTPVAAPSGGIDFDGVIAQLESRSLSFPAELLALTEESEASGMVTVRDDSSPSASSDASQATKIC